MEAVPLLNSQSQYARVSQISPWIPEVNPLHPRARTMRVQLHQRQAMLIMQATLATVFACVSLSVMIWAVVRFSLLDDTGTFYTGSCRTVHFMDGLWHVVLNVASTLFLGAGNYCMQVLVAPSRKDVRKAHAEGISMDIGVHSFRNVWRISYTKRTIWLLLGVNSTIMHLFWNSAIFSSIPYTIYPIAVATSDFQEATDNWADFDSVIHHSRDHQAIHNLKHKATDFDRLSNRECIEAHIDPRSASAELIVVTNVTTEDHIRDGAPRSLMNGWENGFDHYTWNMEYNWICSGLRQDANEKQQWTTCTKEWILPDDKEPEFWKVYGVYIQYCLQGRAGNNEERCGLHFSRTIFVIVAICIILEAGLTCAMAYIGRTLTMVTLGDAQAEFLIDPDDTTGASTEKEKPGEMPFENKTFARVQKSEWRPINQFKLHAVGPSMWIWTVVSITAAVALGLGLFSMSLIALRRYRQEPTLGNVWRSGIGRINSYMLIGGAFRQGTGTTQVIVGHILFANIFQLMISIIYLLYNNCLTRQVLADQWTRFMRTTKLVPEGQPIPDRKPLRVSSHVGFQRTSYMLSLPWSYAMPMMLAFTIPHTLIARSVFLVRTAAFGPGLNSESQRLFDRDASRVGFSSMGILLSTIVGSLILLSLLFNSFRRYHGVPKHLPRMANKTAFISAACQRPDDDVDAYLFPVTLMAVSIDSGDMKNGQAVRRLAFSTDSYAMPPVVGEVLEQPMPVDQHDDWDGLKEKWHRTTGFFTGLGRKKKDFIPVAQRRSSVESLPESVGSHEGDQLRRRPPGN